MSAIKWLGTAATQAQVDTLTVGGTIEADDVFTITLTGEDGSTQSLSVVAGSTVAATVATAISAAFNASKQSLFTAITAAPSSATVVLTADTAGVPFYCSVATTETGGGGADDQTFTRAATTVNSGPSDWNVAANWSGGVVPVGSDDVYIENTSASILYGLNQASVTLSSLTIDQSYTGYIGTATADLKVSATALKIGTNFGSGTPAGSGRIRINTGSNACTGTIYNTAVNGADSGFPPVRIRANHASTAFTVLKGSVLFGGDAPSFSSAQQASAITLGSATDSSADVTAIIASGVTLATLTVNGGLAYVDNAPTTVYPNGGVSDFTRNTTGRTVTTLTMTPKSSGAVKYDSGVLTVTTFTKPVGIVTVTAQVA